MDEASKRRWDVIIAGVIAPGITVIGILVGIWQFSQGEENRLRLQYELLSRQNELEFRRELWKEQLKAYQAVVQLAGRLAADSDDPQKVEPLYQEFLASYWGLMIFFEDSEIERLMKEFHVELRDLQRGRSNPDRIKTRADLLINALRQSSRNWEDPGEVGS